MSTPNAPRPLPREVDVAVVGAGIGGAAAGVALSRAGLDVHVFERTPVLKEVGGSIIIREPSTALLDRWGLGNGFRAAAVAVDHIAHWDDQGNRLGTSLTDVLGDGQAYAVHRADVHDLLVGALPADRLHLGVSASGARNDGERAVVDLEDGTAVRAKLVVGADGIRSVVRPAVVDDELRFAHLVILRMITPASALPDGVTNDRLHTWTKGEKLLMALPVRSGRQLALDTVIEADEPPAELWNTRVPTAKLVEGFGEFYRPLVDLIAAGDESALASPVYERAPIHTWSAGRITLLGDAAHPMAPRQGQGANQAVQDAGALASALATAGLDDVAGALADYEAQRVEQAATIQTASQANPELRAADGVA